MDTKRRLDYLCENKILGTLNGLVMTKALSRKGRSTSQHHPPPFPRNITKLPCVLSFLALAILVFIYTVFVGWISNKKTIAGHNLEATPWHPFPQNKKQEKLDLNATTIIARAFRIFQCSYLTCPTTHILSSKSQLQDENVVVGGGSGAGSPNPNRSCPSFFRWIHRDLAPWKQSRISSSTVAEAQKYAAMRIVILEGRYLYVDLYFACVQSRAMFTIWGLLQLLKRYPGMIPDVDLMFDCMDRPQVSRSNIAVGRFSPPPLFRYCTTRDHFDIPFPDWSFWGWPEINIEDWNKEFKNIKIGSEAVTWAMKDRFAYWRGNPYVQSPIRIALLGCNDSDMWGAQILRQDWVEESRYGFQNSKLSSQCKHRYKIYAEGYAWSVSLKYILACGSLTLIVDPYYEDFFSRSLVPRHHFWPINATNLCQSIKFAVDWGNNNPLQAEAIGKRGQKLMQVLDMDRVYDYMYHLITEYSKLQDFKPAPPPTAQKVCAESLLCFADKKQKKFLRKSGAMASTSLPCTLPPS